MSTPARPDQPVHARAGSGGATLRLPYRPPMDLGATLRFLGARAIPGVEQYADGVFTRTLDLPGGPALMSLSAAPDSVACRVRPSDDGDLDAAVSCVRRLLDLDADPEHIDAALARDPVLAALVNERPGLRSPGAADGFEMAVRAVVGQQISVRGARTVLGRIVAAHGLAAHGLPACADGPWRLFPRATELAAIDPATLPMPRARARTLVTVAEAVAGGSLTLDPAADPGTTRARLLALPGIGPWTADYLRMRALGDPDVLLTTDLGVRKAATALSFALDGGQQQWAPWRSYLTHHLWATL